MKVGIVGLGLIGGSMAIDLKRKGFAEEIYGVEAEPVNAAAAEKIGLVDKVLPFGEHLDLTTFLTIDRVRTPGNNGENSSGKHRIPE